MSFEDLLLEWACLEGMALVLMCGATCIRHGAHAVFFELLAGSQLEIRRPRSCKFTWLVVCGMLGWLSQFEVTFDLKAERFIVFAVFGRFGTICVV